MVQIVEVVSDHIPWDLCGHDPDCPDRAYWHAGHAIGMLVMLVCTIGTLIVSILKVVYIYKMANVLKKA